MSDHHATDEVAAWWKEHDWYIDLEALAAQIRDHSIFAPSSSAMWLACSGSLVPNILADDDAGEDAAWGTVAHSVAETWLKTGKKPKHLIGTNVFVESMDWGFLIWIDDYMMDVVQEYVDYCRMLPGDHFVEQRVDLSKYMPIRNQGGTADFGACLPGELILVDFKGGRKSHVYAKDNSQLLLYALGFFDAWDHKYNFQIIRVRIVQPRRENFDEFEITRAELLAFGEYVKERAALAWQLNAPRTAGVKQCEWCKIKPKCAAYAKLMADITGGAFADLINPQPMTEQDAITFKDNLALTAIPKLKPIADLDVSEMAILYSFRPAYDKWWEKLHLELLRAAFEGKHVPMWKLVESKSNRVVAVSRREWEGHLKSLGFTDEEIYPKKDVAISPAQAETIAVKTKKIKRGKLPEIFAGMIRKPPGKPTLAPIHDKRPALSDISGFAFADLIDSDKPDEEL